jgi:tRNA(Ile)-lysidine synthase
MVNIIHATCVINNKTWYNMPMVIEKIEETAVKQSLFSKGDHIVLGISGGPDSVCLLHALYCLKDRWELTLHAVHVNHGIRGKEADSDQSFTENYCRKLNVPCTVFHFDVPAMAREEGISEEEMGRLLRYKAFHQVRESILPLYESKVLIAVAQNRNDQAETILLRLIRGTGTEGLAGIEYIRDGIIIRPLLDVKRTEIEKYCRENDLSARTDLTNLMPMYARNRVRLKLLPLLGSYNPGIIDSLCRLGSIASEDREYFNIQVEKALGYLEKPLGGDNLKAASGNRYLDRKGFRLLHPSLSKRLIARVFKDMGLLQDISFVHLEKGDAMVREGRSGAGLDFPRGYRLAVTMGEVEFSFEAQKEKGQKFDFCYPVNSPGLIELPELNAALRVKIIKANTEEGELLRRKTFPRDPFHVYIEYDKDVFSCLELRTRSTGDYLTPLGMKGTKKLQDFFVDEKIPFGDRDKIPLLCFGREVLWVVGYRINDRFKIKINDRDAVSLEYIRY